jgi:hypothetical protein
LQNPQETVLKIYKQVGWEPEEKFVEKLLHEGKRNINYKSTHDYSLERYGLSKIKVYNELGDIMDEFGFEKEF